MNELNTVRHARERGKILLTLKEEYSGRGTRVADLHGALDLLGTSMTQESLQFSLVYLADEGYVQISRARELPGWRKDRAGSGGDDIVFAKLLPKGVRLIDGQEPENAGVLF